MVGNDGGNRCGVGGRPGRCLGDRGKPDSLALRRRNLEAVWGSGPDDVWAVGQNGTIVHLQADLPAPFGGDCEKPLAIYCASTLHGSNAGGPANLSSYSCGTADDLGQEVYYRLENPVTGTLTVTMTPVEGDLDLIVVGADGVGACDVAGQCLGSSQLGGTAEEQITLNVTQGETYYFIVDGFGSAVSAYTIDVSCTKQ